MERTVDKKIVNQGSRRSPSSRMPSTPWVSLSSSLHKRIIWRSVSHYIDWGSTAFTSSGSMSIKVDPLAPPKTYWIRILWGWTWKSALETSLPGNIWKHTKAQQPQTRWPLSFCQEIPSYDFMNIITARSAKYNSQEQNYTFCLLIFHSPPMCASSI